MKNRLRIDLNGQISIYKKIKLIGIEFYGQMKLKFFLKNKGLFMLEKWMMNHGKILDLLISNNHLMVEKS